MGKVHAVPAPCAPCRAPAAAPGYPASISPGAAGRPLTLPAIQLGCCCCCCCTVAAVYVSTRKCEALADPGRAGRNPVEHSSAWCVRSPTVRMALACAVGHGRHAHDGTHRTAHVCGVGKVHAEDRPRLHRFHQLGRAVRPLTSPAGQSGRIFAAAAAAPLPLPLENSPCLGRYATAAVCIGG